MEPPTHAGRPLRAHAGHEFDGAILADGPGGTRLVAAMCSCGDVLDVADPAFAACDAAPCGPTCARCAGTGQVLDHRALAWRDATPEELMALRA